MKALVYRGARDVRIEEVNEPKIERSLAGGGRVRVWPAAKNVVRAEHV
jgi:hypothetical protein